MNHDRCSLGVVLLEIGLWLPLHKDKSVHELHEQGFQNMEERYTRIREALMDLARNKLAIAVKCLRAKSADAYDLSRPLHEVVWPLWDMKSSLEA